ncbi:hypothetical protein [Mycetocola miduiensis]|uniref:Uncharacterized protein n=1 Tax=Mycetocola miduiensis TaxID=995034 RepID=A0A1I4YQU4_9MICO|nr:hypothetical protein [Mycetocola miduiensis]SFN40386.1 hypothetical protein SAMN05216219_0443 [Mycetocola miduiensis]
MYDGAAADSWAVYEEDDSTLAPLLIVRELLGLHRFDERNLPVLGHIETLEGIPRRHVHDLASEWNRWWLADVAAYEGVSFRSGGFGGSGASSNPVGTSGPGLPPGQKLQDFLTHHWLDVAAYQRDVRLRARAELGEARDSDLTMSELVITTERCKGTRALPFRLQLEVLPFATSGLWPVTPTRYLVSSRLRRDRAGFAAAIAPVIESLGW